MAALGLLAASFVGVGAQDAHAQNPAPTRPTVHGATFHVPEDAPVGSEIGRLAARNFPSGPARWRIATANVPFAIDDEGALSVAGALDHEARDGVYRMVVELTQGGDTATAPVTINVLDVNEAPVADAGEARTVMVNTLVTLDGSGSHDPDEGDTETLRYAWAQTGGPPVTLSAPDVARPIFTPDRAGAHVFTLTVSDAAGLSDTDEVVIFVMRSEEPEDPPSPGGAVFTDNTAAAEAGSARAIGTLAVAGGTPATWTEQTDEATTYGTFTLTTTGGWTYTLDTDNAAFIALAEGAEGTDTIEFAASVGGGSPVPTTGRVVVTVTGQNDAPEVATPIGARRAIAGSDAIVVELDDVFSDPDTGDTLTFTVSSDDTTVATATVSSPLTVTPVGEGTAMITVTATDGGTTGLTVTETFDVTVLPAGTPPMVSTPPMPMVTPQTATVGSPFSYRFGEVMDPDGDDVSYEATLDDGSALPEWLTFDSGTRTFSGTPMEAHRGELRIRVTVTDDSSSRLSNRATFTLTIGTTPPSGGGGDRLILPEVARLMADSTAGVIGGRVSGVMKTQFTNTGGLRINGHGTLEEALEGTTDAGAWTERVEDEKELKELLSGAEFVMPLNAVGDGAGGMPLALWGSGHYRSLGGEEARLDWDGDLFGAHFGVDGRVSRDLLVGAAVSWHEGALEYDDAGSRGDYDVELIGVHPYVGWTSGDGSGRVWATVGYGEGTLDITPEGGATSGSDLESRMAGVGGSREVWQGELGTLRVRGEVLAVEMSVDRSADRQINALDVGARRVRVTAELSRSQALGGGARVEPSAELGVRHDSGDGRTGGGLEAGLGLGYEHPVRGVTLEGRVRALLGHDGGYEEWGVEGLVRVAPGADGQGVSLSLSPSYGEPEGGVGQMWQRSLRDDLFVRDGDGDEADPGYGMRLDARLGYGVSTSGGLFGGLRDGAGMLTPYAGTTLGDGADRYRTGLEWTLGSGLELDLAGEHDRTANGVDNALLLTVTIPF